MEKNRTIGDRVRTLRLARGETQSQTAAALGFSRTHLTNIERGEDNLGTNKLLLIALYFGTTVDYLLTGKDNLASENQKGKIFYDPEVIAIAECYLLMGPDERRKFLINMVQSTKDSTPDINDA